MCSIYDTRHTELLLSRPPPHTCTAHKNLQWILSYRKQRQVVSQELGQIYINNGPQQQDVFVFLGILQLWHTKHKGGSRHLMRDSPKR